MKIKYSFPMKEFLVWKGRIGERLVEHYIRNVLIPALKKKERYDDVIYSPAWFYAQTAWIKEFELKFLLSKGFVPTRMFLNDFKILTKTLENQPDGFLIKMRKTGKNKSWQEALKILKGDTGSYSWRIGFRDQVKKVFEFDPSMRNKKDLLPIVEGDVEVVEIKTDKSNLAPNQIMSYTNVLLRGYALRLFKVNIVSFEKNDYEIEEKVITKEFLCAEKDEDR